MNEKYVKLKEEKTVLKGKVGVIFVTKDDGYEVKAVRVKPDDDKKTTIIILAKDLFFEKNIRPLKEIVGKSINFRIKDIKDDVIYGERISVLEDEQNAIIEDAKKDPEKSYTAVIKNILEQGAFLSIGDVPVFMYNSGFALGYIPISEKKKIGDKLEVVFHKYNPSNDLIYVRMKEKYKEEMTSSIEDFKVQEVYKGVVRTKTTNLCFVNIAPMIDCLVSPVEGIEVGDETFVKITGYRQVNENEVRVRGKIIIQNQTDDFRL